MAPYPFLDAVEGSRLRLKRARPIGLYTHPPDDPTVVCADELGPVIPRTVPPGPAWSPDGHRINAENRLQPRTGEDLGLRSLTRPGWPADHHARILPQQPLLPPVPATDRGRQSAGRDLDRHRQPLQPLQPVHPDLTGGPPPHPLRLHPRRSQPGSTYKKAGGASSARPPSPDGRSPTATTSPRPSRNRPDQLPFRALDLGPVSATNLPTAGRDTYTV